MIPMSDRDAIASGRAAVALAAAEEADMYGAIPYTATCPGCGRDAPWQSKADDYPGHAVTTSILPHPDCKETP